MYRAKPGYTHVHSPGPGRVLLCCIPLSPWCACCAQAQLVQAGHPILLVFLLRPNIFIYSHHDAVASLLEAVGVSGVAACLIWSYADSQPRWIIMWPVVTMVERSTHLPAALKRDASWMR